MQVLKKPEVVDATGSQNNRKSNNDYRANKRNRFYTNLKVVIGQSELARWIIRLLLLSGLQIMVKIEFLSALPNPIINFLIT